MKYKRYILISILLIIIALMIGVVLHTKSQVKDMFRLNSKLQEEGYYMGDFEFKMMGIAYWLDKGQYLKALTALNKYHGQLESKEGLEKVPTSENKEEELEFYLDLQNPKTGAFISDFYPYPVYNEITENLVDHISSLSQDLGRPLELRYPLKFLDEINTPEKLKTFLDDTAYVGWIGAKLPQTSFVFTRSIVSYLSSEDAISKNNLYTFSPEWKQALLSWCWENQDSKTGFWGPRSRRNHELLKKDLNNTASIIKAFVDKDGNDIYEDFPLRHKKEMLSTTLEVLSEPISNDASLDEIHEWNLKMNKGITMLTRYLLKDASMEDKKEAKKILSDHIRTKFKENYIPSEGSFSYYPNEEHASLDGVGNFFLFKDLGAFSKEKQTELWRENIVELGTRPVSEIDMDNLAPMINRQDTNSVRVWAFLPGDSYLKDVDMIFYPKDVPVLDIMDLTPKVRHWVETASTSMGNWTSKKTTLQDLNALETDEVPVYKGDIPLEKINEILQKHGKIVLIGFDVLQFPNNKLIFELVKR